MPNLLLPIGVDHTKTGFGACLLALLVAASQDSRMATSELDNIVRTDHCSSLADFCIVRGRRQLPALAPRTTAVSRSTEEVMAAAVVW